MDTYRAIHILVGCHGAERPNVETPTEAKVVYQSEGELSRRRVV
jgi:hypothetical protein